MASKVTKLACLEASRAASLASHSAAGLVAGAGFREAAKLLRSSEALARAAVALLLDTSTAAARSGSVGGSRTATTLEPEPVPDAATRAPSKRRRRRNKKKGQVVALEPGDNMEDEVLAFVGTCDGLSSTASSPPARTLTSTRALVPRASRERSPHRQQGEQVLSSPSCSAVETSTGFPQRFSKDQIVLISGLASRPDLNGQRAAVLSYDIAAGRYAVCVVVTKEKLRIKELCLRTSIF